jgi:hypothetical protein
MTDSKFDLSLTGEQFTRLVEILFTDEIREEVMRPFDQEVAGPPQDYELWSTTLAQWLEKVEPTLPPQLLLYDIDEDGIRVLRRP